MYTTTGSLTNSFIKQQSNAMIVNNTTLLSNQIQRSIDYENALIYNVWYRSNNLNLKCLELHKSFVVTPYASKQVVLAASSAAKDLVLYSKHINVDVD